MEELGVGREEAGGVVKKVWECKGCDRAEEGKPLTMEKIL